MYFIELNSLVNVGRSVMNILAYFRLIKRKVNKFDHAVDNPINKYNNYNPFESVYNKTYVWIDNDTGFNGGLR